MTDVRLHRHRFAYEMSDGTAGEVTVQNRTLIAWDQTRGVRKWPAQGDAPVLWQTFLTWHALTLTGEYSGKFDQFMDECEALEMLDKQGNPMTTAQLEKVFADDLTPEEAESLANGFSPRAEDVLPEVDPTRPSPESALSSP